MTLSGLLILLPYHGLMAFSLLMSASLWASGKTRGVPSLSFLFLGVAAPLAAWLFSIFFPQAALLSLACLGSLILWARKIELKNRDIAKSLKKQAWEEAERTIALDPKNAAGYWALAKACESEGELARALALYRQAHQIDQRTLPAPELRHITDSLERRISRQEKLSEDTPSLSLPSATGKATQILCLAAGVPYLFWNWALGLNLLATLFFIDWLRAAEGEGTDRTQWA